MDSSLQNIIQNLSFEDLSLVESILTKIKDDKLKNLRTSPTLFKFSEEYRKYIESFHSEKYLKSANVSFNHLIRFFGEGALLTDITVKRAEEFVAHISKEAPKGYPVYCRNLKACFNRAVIWKYIAENPFNQIKVPKQQLNKPLYITKGELNKIELFARNETMKRIFSFAFNSGCRAGEIVNLLWDNIDLENELITIGDNSFNTKSRKQRFIPMNKETLKLINEQAICNKHYSKYLFSKESGFPFNPDYISKEFKKAVRATGMNDEIHFHTLRHSFASNLANKGVPIVVIQELLGHSSIIMTQRYSHTNISNLREGIKKL
jgi:integrase